MLRPLLLLVPTLCFAGVTGDPRLPIPQLTDPDTGVPIADTDRWPDEPAHVQHGWVEMTNDNLAPAGRDDGYTFGFRGGFTTEQTVVGFDCAAYTHGRNQSATDIGTRSDETTLTVGRMVTVRRIELTFAIGATLSGNLGGEGIQNTWHRSSMAVPFSLTYGSGYDFSPLVLIGARENLVLGSGFSLQPTGSSSVYYDAVQLSVAVPIAWQYREFSCAVGIGYQMFHGHSLSDAACYYHHHMNGWTISGDLRMANLYFEWTCTHDKSYGGFGVVF